MITTERLGIFLCQIRLGILQVLEWKLNFGG